MKRDGIRAIAEEEQKLEMTPMIDVTFLLLVFFLCTLRFKSLEGKLGAYLPKELGLVEDESFSPPIPVDVRLSVVAPGVGADSSLRDLFEKLAHARPSADALIVLEAQFRRSTKIRSAADHLPKTTGIGSQCGEHLTDVPTFGQYVDEDPSHREVAAHVHRRDRYRGGMRKSRVVDLAGDEDHGDLPPK